jgi:hypothetical protein
VLHDDDRDSRRTENRNALSHRVMLQLVMEHLDNEQHSKTVQAIQKESNLLCTQPFLTRPFAPCAHY